MTLADVLAQHSVTPEDIEKAKSYQARAGGSLEKILLNMGCFSEELLPAIYSKFLNYPLLTDSQRDSWKPPVLDPSNKLFNFLLDSAF